jgi:ArsR family transcriptional regulator
MTSVLYERRCRALGSLERVRLINCLSTPKSVSELLTRCSLSQSALSQHLKVLRDAEVVRGTRSGRNIVYRVPDKKMLTVARLLLEEGGGRTA